MEYQGPTGVDLADVHALNRCFLKAILAPGAMQFAEIGADRMTEKQITRLSGAPFLLFSLREQDDEYWQRTLGEDAQMDLIDTADAPSEKIRELQAAALGFLWQLSRRNPYAVRLVSGATVSWCERLAEMTLVVLLQKVAMRGDLMRIRFHKQDPIWRRMLDCGAETSYQSRLASQHCALQAILTQRSSTLNNRMSAAACRVRAPGIRAPKV